MCVFFPFILDIKFVGRTSRGHTGGRSHRIFHPPYFCDLYTTEYLIEVLVLHVRDNYSSIRLYIKLLILSPTKVDVDGSAVILRL